MNEKTQTDQKGQFGIQKVYIKDVSFETPNSPLVFQEQWNPRVNMDIQNTSTRLNEELHEVVLSVTVTVTADDRTVYLAEVQQAGIFRIFGFGDEVTGRMLATVCTNILFPFVREFIADLVMRGGFPQLLLAPVNFDALYLQQQKAQQESGGKVKH